MGYYWLCSPSILGLLAALTMLYCANSRAFKKTSPSGCLHWLSCALAFFFHDVKGWSFAHAFVRFLIRHMRTDNRLLFVRS